MASIDFDMGSDEGSESYEAEQVEQHEQEEVSDAGQGTGFDAGQGMGFDAEAEARALGWRPQEEFRGDTAHWVDATEFLERGQNIMPILKANNRKLQQELRTRDDQINELKLTMREFSEMYRTMSESAYKKAMSDIKTQIRDANQSGDYDLADQLNDQYDQLREDSKNIKVPQVSTPAENPQQKQWLNTIEDWRSDNSWYENDKVLTRQMNAIAQELALQDQSLMGTRKLLDLAEKQLREDMPDRFRNTRRAVGSPVAGSSDSRASAKAAGNAAKDLPPEARESGKRFVKQGLFKDMEAYAKAFFDDSKGVIG